MEEEKKNSETKLSLPKYFLASYTPKIPVEILSFLDENSKLNSKEYQLIHEHILEIIDLSNPSCFSIKKKNNEYSDVLCKVFEINCSAFQKFLEERKISKEVFENLNDRNNWENFNCEYECEDFRIKLSFVAIYKNLPLITFSFSQKNPSTANCLEEKTEKELEIFLKEFVSFFKERLDKKSTKLYLSRLLSPYASKEKYLDLIEKILIEIFPEDEKVQTKEEKILFKLKTKSFYGQNILEIPKFNKNTNAFENGETKKLITS